VIAANIWFTVEKIYRDASLLITSRKWPVRPPVNNFLATFFDASAFLWKNIFELLKKEFEVLEGKLKGVVRAQARLFFRSQNFLQTSFSRTHTHTMQRKQKLACYEPLQ
jgi:hypothetical protein